MATLLTAIYSDISGYRELTSGLVHQIVHRKDKYVYLGTALGQATMLWNRTFNVPKNDSVVVDLAELTDVDGKVVELQFIKALKVSADRDNLTPLFVQPTLSDGFSSMCDGTLTLDPDSNMLFVNTTGLGWSLLTGSKLELVNSGTVSDLSCTITVVGV